MSPWLTQAVIALKIPMGGLGKLTVSAGIGGFDPPLLPLPLLVSHLPLCALERDEGTEFLSQLQLRALTEPAWLQASKTAEIPHGCV